MLINIKIIKLFIILIYELIIPTSCKGLFQDWRIYDAQFVWTAV